MERAAFLIEDTGQRIGCLLNPESLVMTRSSGIEQRPVTGNRLTGNDQGDDPVFYSGGGTTELELDLLFDIDLAGSSIDSIDVRDLTRYLWDLTEKPSSTVLPDGYIQPPIVRFIWGKAWNVRGVITSVSERLEFFDVGGFPKRSWLKLKLLRVQKPTDEAPANPLSPEELLALAEPDTPEENPRLYQVLGEGGENGTTERLDELARRFYGDPSFWRLIAQANNIDDPQHLKAGQLLILPTLPGQVS